MFICYIFFYFSRKSLVFIFPLMINELKISIYDIGLINSIFYIAYAFSKFFSGIVTDKYNYKYFMFIALIFTGIFNLFIGICDTIFFITLFWFFNAMFQGCGWPPITKQLTYFYKKSERGVWWSVLSISHNIGGAMAPIIIGILSIQFIWRINFFIIGISCIFLGCILIFFLRKVTFNQIESKNSYFNNDFNITEILMNKNILLLSICYFFIYFIKTAFNDWLIIYMINQREHTLFSSSMLIFYFEFGGIIGIIFSGWITDKIIFNRIFFLIINIIFLCITSLLFYNIPVGFKFIEYFIIFFLGFFLFAPQMLVGLIASEVVNKNSACTANSFVGSFAYIGSALAGYPFSLIINISWNVYFIVIILSEIILIPLLILIFLNAKYYE